MKKTKRISKWMILNKEFNTFKAFKRFAWYNMVSGEVTEGLEIFEDTILKSYNIKKTERSLIIEIIYNLEEEVKKYFKSLQLNLFDNENNK